MNSTLREAECPVCFELFSEEIYLCETGHSLCGECSKTTQICPLCKQSMRKQRNYALEAVLQQLMAPKPTNMRITRSSSTAAEFNCPLDEADKCLYSTKTLDQLRFHLVDHHKISIKTCSSGSFIISIKNSKNLTGHIDSCNILDFKANLFKFYVKLNYNNNRVCCAMQMIGFTKDNGYSFAVDYNRENVKRKKFSAKASDISKVKDVFVTSYVTVPLNFFLSRAVGGKIHIYGELHHAGEGGST